MQHYIGLMSGTSLDGVDAALVAFDGVRCEVRQTHYQAYSDELKTELLALHEPRENELEHSQIVANRLARLYAEAVHGVLQNADVEVAAIGCHGQTIRHRPELGFTLQINNPSLLAELTHIPVVADFRSRDIAAGGQGAPLVPAFHRAVFGHQTLHRVIVNIGGISNLTDLPPHGEITGFDCGPGNLLMDAWCKRHTGRAFDESGKWANGGKIDLALLSRLQQEAFFWQRPPKSTGRDLFNLGWLEDHLGNEAPQDVQATLAELSALGIADAIKDYCPETDEIYLCGGGAHNLLLTERLRALLPGTPLLHTDALGIPVDWVEAAAFAWLAKQTIEQKPGNLPSVTGATGLRVLGAIYAA
jgi:anhydro-N-acetylmuramic acid kinase